MNTHIPEPDSLAQVSQNDLNEAIRLHAMYLNGQSGGARAIFQYCDLSDLCFKKCDLSQADFTGSMFIGADLSGCVFMGANFFACDMRNANMELGNFSRADFRGAYVAGANLEGANMSGVDLREGKIMKRSESGSLEDRKRSGGAGARTVFSGARMRDTNMSGAQAHHADFSDSDLSGAIIAGANLSGVSFEGTNMTDADLSGADLSDASMRHSVITGMRMDGAERQGLDQSSAVSERDMGDNLANLEKSLSALLEEHTLWVATAGRSGRQLDLSGYDLRDVLNLKRFPLTAIHCIGGNFLNQNLKKAEMQSGVFDRSDFRDCKMVGADLRGSSLKYAQMARVDLSGALLCPLEFDRADQRSSIQRVDLSGASLKFSRLCGADLRDAILMGVDFTHANLAGCDLRRADFTGAILNGVNFDGCQLGDAVIDLGAV